MIGSAMEAADLNLFYYPKDRLRMTVGQDRSYPTVKPVWAAPLSHPDRYLCLLDGKGKEIVTLDEPSKLSQPSFDAVLAELGRRYLTAQIHRVLEARSEFGATYWTVVTDRGQRDFVTQSLQENAQWLGDGHLLLVDVDGNRFEIKDAEQLDLRSKTLIEQIL